MARRTFNHQVPFALTERVALDQALIEGFVETFLFSRFDKPCPTPTFHRTLWKDFCSNYPLIAEAAPRGHAKSTAITFSALMANMLFGVDDFALIIGSTEEMAAKHLAEISTEFETNADLVDAFKLTVLTSNETELVVRCGGREFCIIAKAPGQKVRGIKWRHKRPSLIVCDDIEEDEAVSNPDRRRKLLEWYYNALLPCGADNLRVRDVGTILHLDSLKEHQMKDSLWLSRRFKAHESFDDFSNILWPEKFTEKRLRELRQRYINQGNAAGYSQEYLSWPILESEAFFLRKDFLPMEGDDFLSPKTIYIGVDGATSTKTRSDKWAFVVGGMDSEGLLHIIHVVNARMDTLEAVNTMFKLELEYRPEVWIVANDMIQQSIGPFLYQEMRRRGVYLNVDHTTVKTHNDKRRNAQAFRARMRAQGVHFDTTSDWFPPYQTELISFDKGEHDDCVDASANIGLYLDKMVIGPTSEELEEEDFIQSRKAALIVDDGRDPITNY